MTDFPENFQGPGPMFAALPIPAWRSLIVPDTSVHVVEMDENGTTAVVFLDENDAEMAAEGRGGTWFTVLPGIAIYGIELEAGS